MLIKGFLVRAAAVLWPVLGCLVPKKNDYVLLNTFPDFDDTARSFSRNLPDLGYKVIILTTKKEVEPPAWALKFFFAIEYRYSLRGVWLYFRSKYIFYTHGLFSAFAPSASQVIVNLWHGMPIKRIGLMDGKRLVDIPRFHYSIANDLFFQKIVAESFGVERSRILLNKHPRIDVLRNPSHAVRELFPESQLLCVWLPTYRSSFVGDVRSDGCAASDVFSDAGLISRMDEFFRANDVLCVAKPHPMARVSRHTFEKCSNIFFVEEDFLLINDLTLYQILSISDFLITDISSVYVDYLFLDRPIVVYCRDLEDYEGSRGFTAPLGEMVKDRINVTESDLFNMLEQAVCKVGGGLSFDVINEGAAVVSLMRKLGKERPIKSKNV